MSYDLHGSWESFLGHQAPLFARKDENDQQAKLNTAWAVNYWLSKGCPRYKLMMGLALYGRSFRHTGNTNLGAPNLGPGTQGKVVNFLILLF